MSIEKVMPSGAWQISDIIEGEGDPYFLTRTYYGYTKKEAVKLWRQHLSEKAL